MLYKVVLIVLICIVLQRISYCAEDIGNRLQALENLTKAQQMKLEVLEAERGVRSKRQETQQVAFYAQLSGTLCIGKGATIIFDKEVTDTSNSYNSGDGIFTAPVSGTYVFTHRLTPETRKWAQSEMMVNGVVKDVFIADSSDGQDIHPASGTIVVRLNAGDHVFVRRRNGYGGCDIISSANFALTTFSGWFLF